MRAAPLCPQVRLGLAQADDARRFGAAAATGSAASGSSVDLAGGATRLTAADQRADALARRLAAALLQEPGRPASLAEQVWNSGERGPTGRL